MTSLRLAVALALAAVVALPSTALAARTPKTVDVQLLALNDFHGNLEPPAGLFTPAAGATGLPAGGVAHLATHVRRLEAQNPRNTLVVSAGDLIGASPLVSALFRDEPTIEAMNLLGLDLNAVGNHEFDDGAAELRRMQDGGCHPADGCFGGDGFAGADFSFLSANVRDDATGRSFFRSTAIKHLGGERVGFIGLTLEGTPQIVSPAGIAGLRFLDEADTINQRVKVLERQGVESIVVLLHEGGVQSAPGGIDDCNGISGPVVDIVQRSTPEVDLFVTGHTHQAYRCVIDGRAVTSASSFGRVLTDIDLTIDRRSGDVREVRADNLVVTRDVDRAPDLTQLVERYAALAAPLRDRVIGSITADLTRDTTPAGESALGDVIADSQLAATQGAGAVAALMNPGGIRADLLAAPSGTEQPGEVTYGEAFTVQPFGNTLQTLTLTGAQLDTLLEQQWCEQDPTRPRILQVSAGFTYTWDASRPVCDRVDAATIAIGGTPVTPAGTYRITVNSFLAEGGDNFTVLRDATERTGGGLDLDALAGFFAAGSPVAPGPCDRITVVGA